MDIEQKIRKSHTRLRIIGFVVLFLLIILSWFACRFVIFLFQKSEPIEFYQFNNYQIECIDSVFKNYQNRWNLECANLPEGLKANPNQRDMDFGFACGLPQSIAIQLNNAKQSMEKECIGEQENAL